MNELFIIVSSWYFILIVLLIAGLAGLKKISHKNTLPVSVIIPARNEEDNIRECIKYLLNQNYSGYEIIIVNDRSEDKTAQIIEKYARKHNNLVVRSIKELPAGLAPKKYAITQGIEASRGEIILTTDADCRPPETWISTMVSFFSQSTSLVAGFSPVFSRKKKSSFTSGLFYLDSLSLAGISAGGIGLNIPLSCNGRNLAYRKNSFRSAGGFGGIENIPSGDDDLLLHKIVRLKKTSIKYAAGKISHVPSLVQLTIKEFLNQRIRHASKFGLHPLRVKIISAIIYLFNLSILFFPAVDLFTKGHISYLSAIVIGMKFSLDLFFLTATSIKLEARFNFFTFFILFFIYPFYIIIFGALGVVGKYKWKD